MNRKISETTRVKNLERSIQWQKQNKDRKNQLNRECRLRKKQELEALKTELENLRLKIPQ